MTDHDCDRTRRRARAGIARVRPRARTARAGVAVLLLGGGLAAVLAADAGPAAADVTGPTCSGGTCVVDLSYPSSGAAAQDWTVPPGVTSATFTLWGASGGAGVAGGGAGGIGAEARVTLDTSGTPTYVLYVGGAGGVASAESAGTNGSGDGGGGAGGVDSGGGGASSELSTSTTTDTRTLAAGGGGGGALNGNGYEGSPRSPAGGSGGAGDSDGDAGGPVTVETVTLGGGGGGFSGDDGGAEGTAGTASAGNEPSDPGCGVGTSTGPGTSGSAGSSSTGDGGTGAVASAGGGGGGLVGGGGGSGGASDVCGNDGGGSGGGGGSSTAGDVVTPTASDPGGENGYAEITYGDPISAGSASYTASAGSTLSVVAASGLVAEATGPGGDALDASLVSGPSHGSVSVSNDGSFSYTPDDGYVGSDAFTYEVTDSSQDDATGTASITVAPLAQTIEYGTSPPSSPTVGGTYTPEATGGGSGNPVTFSIDTSSATGACSYSSSTGEVSFTGTGTCIIDADQAAGGVYAAAGEVQQSFEIAAAPVVTTTTTTTTPPTTAPLVAKEALTIHRDVPVVGASATFSATVGTPSGAAVPGGTVTFSVGRTTLCTATVHGGHASCTSRRLPRAGDLVVRATYSGTAGVTATLTELRVAVSPGPVVVAVSKHRLGPGRDEYQATLKAARRGFGPPRGSVTFTSGHRALCSARIVLDHVRCDAPAVTGRVSARYHLGKDYRAP